MSGLKYTFSNNVIEFKNVVPRQKWNVLFNGEIQYSLGEGNIFITRLIAKQLNIPEWDNSPEPYDTHSLLFAG